MFNHPVYCLEPRAARLSCEISMIIFNLDIKGTSFPDSFQCPQGRTFLHFIVGASSLDSGISVFLLVTPDEIYLFDSEVNGDDIERAKNDLMPTYEPSLEESVKYLVPEIGTKFYSTDLSRLLSGDFTFVANRS